MRLFVLLLQLLMMALLGYGLSVAVAHQRAHDRLVEKVDKLAKIINKGGPQQ